MEFIETNKRLQKAMTFVLLLSVSKVLPPPPPIGRWRCETIQSGRVSCVVPYMDALLQLRFASYMQLRYSPVFRALCGSSNNDLGEKNCARLNRTQRTRTPVKRKSEDPQHAGAPASPGRCPKTRPALWSAGPELLLLETGPTLKKYKSFISARKP
ncbi:hypothetical protein EVAR_14382_1 [Eumeta japonica]|uniref:Uncharacterized protein n=1 Tax=Eumeta variegata TaxID=151549 RepID=A0A4C1TX57_EUMVA|nr:hypothetical protein EVAR_14382_1 [Eumeta japonica]